MVGIVAILHHFLSTVRSVRFKIIEKYMYRFLQTSDVGIFFMVIEMIGGTLKAVIHVGIAVVLMSKALNKRPCNNCLNKFYLRHVNAMGDTL